MKFEKKMACRYESFKDLNDRLHGTFVLYRGQIVKVMEIMKNPCRLVICSPYKDFPGGEINIRPNDPDLDISGFELGYVNTPKGVSYIFRTPAKHYKQGTCVEHLTSKDIQGGPDQEGDWAGKGFFEMLEDKYPSIDEARELFRDERRDEIAISKSVALMKLSSGVVLVHLRCHNYGWMTPDLNSCYISDGPMSWIVRSELQRVGLIPRKY